MQRLKYFLIRRARAAYYAPQGRRLITALSHREAAGLGQFTPGGSSLSIRAHLLVARIDQIGVIIDGFTMALFLRARLRQLI